MAERAHVASIEALESFRAALLVYMAKTRPTLEEAADDVLRTRLWLENEQRVHWEGQLRRHSKALEQAQQSLSSARFSSLREASAAEQAAVIKARRGVDQAEDKLRRIKQWARDFDSRVEPVARQLDKLTTFLANDLPKAAASLAQAVKILDAYAGGAIPSALDAGAPPPASEAPSAPDPAAAAEPAPSAPTDS